MYVQLTSLGKFYGKSPHAIGRILVELGLKDEITYLATPLAVEEDYARNTWFDQSHQIAEWNLDKCLEILDTKLERLDNDDVRAHSASLYAKSKTARNYQKKHKPLPVLECEPGEVFRILKSANIKTRPIGCPNKFQPNKLRRNFKTTEPPRLLYGRFVFIHGDLELLVAPYYVHWSGSRRDGIAKTQHERRPEYMKRLYESLAQYCSEHPEFDPQPLKDWLDEQSDSVISQSHRKSIESLEAKRIKQEKREEYLEKVMREPRC